MAKIIPQNPIPIPCKLNFQLQLSWLLSCEGFSPLQLEEIIFKKDRDQLGQVSYRFLLLTKALQTPKGKPWWETFPKNGEQNINV